jgi:hypothetical protein
VFGSYEIINGSNYADVTGTTERSWEKRNFTQYAVEGVYRFLKNEQLFIGARYNKVTGEPRGVLDASGNQAEIGISRLAFSAGWFPTKNLLLKGEFVSQEYTDFPTTDYRYEGKFSGFMVQAVVGF